MLSGYSTLFQFLEQLDVRFLMLQNGSNVDIIHLNYSKAYDKVDLFILLARIEAWGISDKNIAFECNSPNTHIKIANDYRA